MLVQEDELEPAGLCNEMDQHEADLAAINKVLGSPFVQRDAMRTPGWRDFLLLLPVIRKETDCGTPLTPQLGQSAFLRAMTRCRGLMQMVTVCNRLLVQPMLLDV